MKYQTAILNQQGGRDYNEDACDFVELEEQFNCWVVADGLGGHGGGEVASNLAVESMLNTFVENRLLTTNTLELQFGKAQKSIIEMQKSSLKLAKMQTTAVVFMTHNDQGIWGHIGDSRLYYFHKGQIEKQTSDHSVPQKLANAGEIDATQIRYHEDRNRLLQSLGSKESIKPTLETATTNLHPGDAFLLCTDGFWEYVLEDEMVEDLKQAISAQEWLNSMYHRLLDKAPDGNDNYSAIAITISKSDNHYRSFTDIMLTGVRCKPWFGLFK